MRATCVIIMLFYLSVTCNSLKHILSFSKSKSMYYLQCKKCKYYKIDKKRTERCTRFIKVHDEKHRLIANSPSYVIEDYFYVPIDECRQNQTLCGENAVEFYDKRNYWQ